jgi:hypothetical protein
MALFFYSERRFGDWTLSIIMPKHLLMYITIPVVGISKFDSMVTVLVFKLCSGRNIMHGRRCKILCILTEYGFLSQLLYTVHNVFGSYVVSCVTSGVRR